MSGSNQKNEKKEINIEVLAKEISKLYENPAAAALLVKKDETISKLNQVSELLLQIQYDNQKRQ